MKRQQKKLSKPINHSDSVDRWHEKMQFRITNVESYLQDYQLLSMHFFLFFLCCVASAVADPCHLILIRHGETEALANRIYHENSGLNAKGKQQALDIIDQLQGIPIAAIYSSPLRRAVQTAGPLALVLNLPVIIYDALKERSHGSAEGLPMACLEGTASFNLYYYPKRREDLSIRLVPDAENFEESTLRFSSILKTISTNHPGQTVVVFCHFGLLQGLRILLTQRFDHPPILNGSSIEIRGEAKTLTLHVVDPKAQRNFEWH